MSFASRIRKGTGAGFSLIEVLISMGLVSVLALVIFALNNFMNSGKNTSDAAFQADQFRKDVLQMLNNPTAWRYTLIKNATSFACVTSGAGGNCQSAVSQGPATGDYSNSSVSTATGGFDVYDASGAVFYAPASNTWAGFQKSGAQCSAANPFVGTYNAGKKKWTSPTSKCPFRLVLWWQPICPTNAATQCSNPPVHVKGYTIYAPSPSETGGQFSFNPGNYGIDVILPPNYQ